MKNILYLLLLLSFQVTHAEKQGETIITPQNSELLNKTPQGTFIDPIIITPQNSELLGFKVKIVECKVEQDFYNVEVDAPYDAKTNSVARSALLKIKKDGKKLFQCSLKSQRWLIEKGHSYKFSFGIAKDILNESSLSICYRTCATGINQTFYNNISFKDFNPKK